MDGGNDRKPVSIHAPEPARDGALFFSALVSNAGDTMTLIDSDGVMFYHSDAMRGMMGVEPESVVGIPAVSVVHPDDRNKVLTKIEHSKSRPGETVTEIFRMMHADGSWRWIEANVRNLLEDTQVRGILVVSRDISDQERLKHHLSIAEAAAGFFTFRWQLGDDFIDLSANTSQILGTTLSLTNAQARHAVHPDDYPIIEKAWMNALKTSHPFEISIRLRGEGGTYRHCIVHGSPELNAGGDLQGLMGVVVDATQSFEQQQAILASTEQYQLIAENAQDIFARHTPDRKVTFISPAVRTVLGVEPELCIGVDLFSYMHPNDTPTATEALQKLESGSDCERMTFRLSRVDGEHVWLESTVHAVRSQKTGELTEYFAITRDVSERKEYERKLLDAREKAESANQTKSAFLANMSHELRTPLNAIIGFSEMLKRETFGALGHPKYDEYSGLIHESGLHLLDLINDVLDMSKIEAGKMEMSIEPLDICEIASACLKLVEERATKSNIILSMSSKLHNGSVRAMGDVRATKQILLNLLSNSIKFTPPGGCITLFLDASEDAMHISVRDTGVGIAQADIPRLLLPFEQVTRVSTTAHEGSGLGLALTKSFTELQGGTFHLESAPGSGTTATLSLPLSDFSLAVEYSI
ncbi:MAG: PAS domain S-box protein [Parvibaculum sp.]